MKVLFICSRNRWRSPTAEAIFSNWENLEVLSAGTSIDAENPVSREVIEWADIIFVMEGVHKARLNKQFRSLLRDKRIVVLGIADVYGYMDPHLVEILQSRVAPHLN